MKAVPSEPASESVDGFPGPDATMHSKGLMTFALRGGAITLRVRVRQRFAGDGAHARQSVHGVIVAGRGRYAGAHGSIAGGGTLVDTRAGVRAARLAYTIRLTR